MKNGNDDPRPRGVQPEVPTAKTVTRQNIEVAYCSDRGRYQRKRIKAWGQINLNTLKELGAQITMSKN